MIFDGKCHTLEQLIAKSECTPAELWREICAERGHDECEPWEGWPAGPKRENWKSAPGADRPLPDHWQKLLEHWQQTRPHLIGRQ